MSSLHNTCRGIVQGVFDAIGAKKDTIRAKIAMRAMGSATITAGGVSMKKKEKLKYNIFQNILFLLQGIREDCPILLVFFAAQIVLSVVSPVFGIYLPKVALDLVLKEAGTREIFFVLGAGGFMMMLSMSLSGMADQGKYMLCNGRRTYYRLKLFFQSLSCDYIHVERAEGQIKFRRADATLEKGDASGTSVMIHSGMDMIITLLCFVIYSGIISNLSLVMILVVIGLSLVNLFSTRKAQSYEHTRQKEAADYDRKYWYVVYTGEDARFGKDMRLYQAGGWFMELGNSLIEQIGKLREQIQNRYFAAGIVHGATLFLQEAIAYGYLIYAVANHHITISEFTLYMGAISGFSGMVGRMVNSINQLNKANLDINDMRAFMDSTDEPDPEHPLELSEITDYSIEFRDVSFSYDAETPVLEHLNLKLAAGERVALVGVNGAGKTTLVKLLCRFYTPSSGTILIGGQDICRFRKKDLQKLFSAVFQDIFILPVTVAENVSLQKAEDTDRDKVKACLEKARLWERIAQCEAGIDTPMTREIEEGLVLSGGQQQKLLMARALYKDAPILILDEPTSALDPIAESETYQQFHKMAAAKTAIYISHRLASTRFCDKIAFLKDGSIIEEGTHEELLKRGGAYAQMFEVQSHYYRQEKGGAEDVR